MNIKLKEMDIDALIAQRPEVAIVDELAHTNAPGSRHLKRYQDVIELLENGIDVYTTMNIQHLESLNDTVYQITGVRVRETVPDSIMDEASEIKIVDLPPEELIQRLKDGKVYVPDMTKTALENFFNEGNLIALREMVLRRGAERVDEDMRDYMEHMSIPGPWAASERLLVCIGHNQSLNERLIRRTRHLADETKVKWYALYVETPASNRLLPKVREGVAKALDLAESLGAITESTFGVSEVEEIVKFAKKNNITRVIVGRQLRSWWWELFNVSFVDRLIRLSGAIEVYVITDKRPVERYRKNLLSSFRASRDNYFYCFWMILITSIIAVLIQDYLELMNIGMLYLLVVVIASLRFGLYPAIVTSSLSVLAFDFFFVSPRFTFRIDDTQYLITFATLFIVSIVISYLVVRTKEYAISAQKRETQTLALYSMSQGLTVAKSAEEVGKVIVQNIINTFDWGTVFIVPRRNNFEILAKTPELTVSDKEMAVAIWAYNNQTIAGYQTDTLRDALLRYIPMKTSRSAVGILGIKPNEINKFITPDQEMILQTFANQAALAIERIQFADAAAMR
jgi:two-component system sensor histidine kinase KdpD